LLVADIKAASSKTGIRVEILIGTRPDFAAWLENALSSFDSGGQEVIPPSFIAKALTARPSPAVALEDFHAKTIEMMTARALQALRVGAESVTRLSDTLRQSIGGHVLAATEFFEACREDDVRDFDDFDVARVRSTLEAYRESRARILRRTLGDDAFALLVASWGLVQTRELDIPNSLPALIIARSGEREAPRDRTDAAVARLVADFHWAPEGAAGRAGHFALTMHPFECAERFRCLAHVATQLEYREFLLELPQLKKALEAGTTICTQSAGR
jgi:hypothetical protein